MFIHDEEDINKAFSSGLYLYCEEWAASLHDGKVRVTSCYDIDDDSSTPIIYDNIQEFWKYEKYRHHYTGWFAS